jgi:hypothetical protein
MKSTTVHRLLGGFVCCCALSLLTHLNALAAEKKSASFAAKKTCFIENKGQVKDQFGNKRNDIDYMLRGNGFNLYVANGELHYQFTKMQKNPNEALDIFKRPGTIGDEKIDAYRLDVTLLNANANAQLVREGNEEYFERYYLPGLNGEVAHSYNKLIYKNIYNNIDWVLYYNEATASVKYDFIVHQGGNAADIQMQYGGATQLQLKDGALNAVTPLGAVNEEKPYCYIAGTQQEVTSSFVLNNNVLSFKVGAYNGDLVIDPAVHWITYFGDNSLEYSYAAAADTGGNAYLGGHTTSANGIATTGAFNTTYQGSKDAFVAKFSGAGVLQWATYYGGSASDNFFYMSTDTLGNLYASGITASQSGITTSGAHQQTYGGGVSDAYLVKFDNTGGRVWATYYGGSGDEATTGSFDDYMVSAAWSKYDNSVYLCGMTTSSTGISTTSAYQVNLAGSQDGYIAKFSDNGARLWATYYGGTNDDKLIKMAASDSGFIYAVGPTTSSVSIATPGVHQTSIGGGNDAFIVKFDHLGLLQWCTYMGGAQNDDPAGIAVDHTGAVYIAGSTQSISGISTTGSYQNNISPGGSTESYLEKFSPTGQRIWGTYFGGTAPDFTADIAIDKSDNICFVGFTGSSGLATAASYQFVFGGNSDGFIAIFGPSGTRSWVSYIGGTNADNAAAISYSRTGDLFVAGSTGSNALATNGAHQTMLAGSQDAFLAKFFADTSAYVLLTFSPLEYCAGDTMYVPYGITNPFLPGNTFTVQLSDPVGGFNSPINLGSVTSTVPGVIPCKIPVTVSGPGYRVRIAYTNPGGFGYPNNYNILIKPLPAKPVITHNSPLCSGKDLVFIGLSATVNATYEWSGPNNFVDTGRSQTFAAATTDLSGMYIEHAILQGCIRADTFIAQVDSTPEIPIITSNSPVCVGDTISINAFSNTGGATYTWVGPSSYTSNVQALTITGASLAKAGYYKATAHLGSCSSKDSGLIEVVPTYTPTVSATATPGVNICLNDNNDFKATASGGGNAPQYVWYLNGNPIPGATTRSWSSTGLKTGDVVYCVFVGDWPCLSRPADTSNKFTINASGNVPPSVTLTATPGLSVPSGTAITFTATHVNGGNFPRYIFMKNGTTLLQDSKLSSYIGVNGKNFKAGDKISCIMISDLTCANPDSAFSAELNIGDDIKPQGINSVNKHTYNVYPNPTSSELHIEGLTSGAKMQLFDVLGKVVLQAEAVRNAEVLNLASLSNGAYMLCITDKEGNREMVKVIRQ